MDSSTASIETTNNQTLSLGGSSTGNIVVNEHLLPGADDTYDLGSATSRWRDQYLGPGSLHIGSAIGDESIISYNTTLNQLEIDYNGDGTADYIFNQSLLTDVDAYWDRTNGAVYPNNSTLDLLLGGTSTTAAKFAVLNNNLARGNQVATLSGDIVLDKSGSLQTTNMQSLTLGGSNTGNLVLDSGSGVINLLDNASITGNLSATSNITFSTFSTNGGLLYTNGSGLLTQLTSQGSSGDCLLSGGAGTAPSFTTCPTGGGR